MPDVVMVSDGITGCGLMPFKLYFKTTKDKKYKEKYKQLKHQVQKEQRYAYNTYIEKISGSNK
jgi:hypothetical protein